MTTTIDCASITGPGSGEDDVSGFQVSPWQQIQWMHYEQCVYDQAARAILQGLGQALSSLLPSQPPTVS